MRLAPHLALGLLCVLAGGCRHQAAATRPSAGAEARWTVYKGAWFEIGCPGGFTARPSLRSSTSEGGYDSAFFAAPDGSVEFYVFSPQWNGEPADIEMDPRRERLVSQSSRTEGGVTVRRVTVRARDGSWTRSFVDTLDRDANTRTVFGIRYRTRSDYDRHRASYLRFKKSLVQYAD